MIPTADRLQHVDAELEALGFSEERVGEVRARAREAHGGDLGAIDEVLSALAQGVAVATPRRRSVPPPLPPAAEPPSTMELSIDELDEDDIELEEVVLEAEPAPSMPVPPQKGLTESVLFGVSSLEDELGAVEEAVLAEEAIASEAPPEPSDELAEMLESEGFADGGLSALEGEELGGGEGEAAEGEAAEGEGEGDDEKKGFFRKLFG